MPKTLAPQLATLVSKMPVRGDWLYEIKFDGYRLMTRFEDGRATLFTRRGHDWSSKLPSLVEELQKIGLVSGWLDGEIVVLGEGGVPDFNALQNSLDRRSSAGVVYFVFDVPFFEGYDLRQVDLRHRRSVREALLEETGTEHIRVSDVFRADPASILSSACRMGLEGPPSRPSHVKSNAARDRDGSHSTAWWSKLPARFGHWRGFRGGR